jgi:hypothetical protein
MTNSTAVVSGSSVVNSTATVGGGIAATAGSDLTLANSTAVAGNAATVGGGIAVDATHLTMTGPVSVSLNKALRPAQSAAAPPAAAAAASADAAAVAAAAAASAVSPLAMFGGQAVLRGLGGGLYAHNSRVLGADVRLDRNTADRVGAGAYTDRCSVRLVGSNISRNQAAEEAGGLKLLNPAQGSSLLNCSVASNWAGLKAGGIAMVGVDLASEVALVGVELLNNTAASQVGGGLWLSGPLGLLMVGGEVSGNTAGTSTVAAAAAAGDLVGSSSGDLQPAGGGVLLEGCSWAALHEVDVYGNTALAGCGGGLAVHGCAKFLLDASAVVGNVAGSGGGMCVTEVLSFLTLHNSRISNNRVLLGSLWESAPATGSMALLSPTPEPHLHCGVQGTGGGMCIAALGEVLINGSSISRNQARNGGAMAVGLCPDSERCSLGLIAADFSNNTAVQGGGGAVYFSTSISTDQVQCGLDYNTSSITGYARGTSFPSLASLAASATFARNSSASSPSKPAAGSSSSSGGAGGSSVSTGSGAGGSDASSGSSSSSTINESVDTVGQQPSSGGSSSTSSGEDDILVSTPGSTGVADGSSGTSAASRGSTATFQEAQLADTGGSTDSMPATTTEEFGGSPATSMELGASHDMNTAAGAVTTLPPVAAAEASPSPASATATPSAATDMVSSDADDGILASTEPFIPKAQSTGSTSSRSDSSSAAAAAASASSDEDIQASTAGFIPGMPGMFSIASLPEQRPAMQGGPTTAAAEAAFRANSAHVAGAAAPQQQQPGAAAIAAARQKSSQRQHRAAEVQLPETGMPAAAADANEEALAAALASSEDAGELQQDWRLAAAAADMLASAGASSGRAAAANGASAETAGIPSAPLPAQLQQQGGGKAAHPLSEAAAKRLEMPVTVQVLQAAEKAGVHAKSISAWQRAGTVSLGALMEAGVVEGAVLRQSWPAYPRSQAPATQPNSAAAGAQVSGWQQQFYASLSVALSRAAVAQAAKAAAVQDANLWRHSPYSSTCDPVQNPAACPVPQHTSEGISSAAGLPDKPTGSITSSSIARAERGRASPVAASGRRRLAQLNDVVTAADAAAAAEAASASTLDGSTAADVTAVGLVAPSDEASSSSFMLQGTSQCGVFLHNSAFGPHAYGPVVTSRPAGLRVWSSATAANQSASMRVATGGQLQVQVSVVDVFGGIITSGAADFIRIHATLTPPLGSSAATGISSISSIKGTLSASMLDVSSLSVVSGQLLDGSNEVDTNGVQLSGLQQLSTSNGSLILAGLQLSGLPGTNTTLWITASDPTLMPASLPITLTSCSAGYMQLPGQCRLCPVGTFSFSADEPLCSLCPAGASCNGTLLVPGSGYWHSSPRSAQVHACLNPAACARDALKQQQLSDWQASHFGRGAIVGKRADHLAQELGMYMQEQCAAGYTGRMCGTCAQDPAALAANRVSHGMVNGACMACGDRKTVTAMFVLVRLWDLALWAALTWLAWRAAKAWAQAVTLNPATAAATAGSLPPTSTAAGGLATQRSGSRPSSKGGSLTVASSAAAAAAAASVAAFAPLHAHVGVFLDYLQLLAVLSASAASYAWPNLLKSFMAAFAFVPLGTSRWVSVECLLPQALSFRPSIVGLLLTAALPLLYLLTSALVWIGGLCRGRTYRTPILALLSGTCLFYPLITMSALSVFSCHTLDDNGTATPGEQLAAVGSYWTLDPELTCYKGQHLQLTLGFGLPVVLLVVFAWPLLLASMLWDSRFRIREQQMHPATRRRYLVRKTIKMCHQLLGVESGFTRPKLYLWPVVVEVRKLLLCVVVVLVGGSPAAVQLYVLWGMFALLLLLEWWARPGATWPIVGLQLVALGSLQAVVYLASAFTQVRGSKWASTVSVDVRAPATKP